MKKITLTILSLIAVVLLIMIVSSKSSGGDDAMTRLIPIDEISHAHGLAVDVEDSNEVYIATHEGLLLLKDEAELYRVGESKDDYMGFSVHPTKSNVFYTSGHPIRGGNMGVQKSEDAGFTWKKISSGFNGPVDFHAMAVSQANPEIMYGWYAGNLQRSEDSGKNWKIVSSEIQAISLTTNPDDENVVYASTPDGMFVSTDRGETWESLSQDLEGGVTTAFAVNPHDANEMIAFSQVLNGFGRSADGGTTWVHVDSTLDAAVLHIAYDPNTSETVYALTQSNKLYKSVDGGKSWKLVF